ncbi:hypothetical protein K7X08_032533 [Anisodus acutangulus]|uniref:Uncharacterized protein n=1 Tax=Anisodus acutangulus TaxID=402998 RepID=A0A9Q1M1N6_9SOLA|nr:hypothetical protein K7X08_032533 [Anisodus acutangulus]
MLLKSGTSAAANADSRLQMQRGCAGWGLQMQRSHYKPPADVVERLLSALESISPRFTETLEPPVGTQAQTTMCDQTPAAIPTIQQTIPIVEESIQVPIIALTVAQVPVVAPQPVMLSGGAGSSFGIDNDIVKKIRVFYEVFRSRVYMYINYYFLEVH